MNLITNDSCKIIESLTQVIFTLFLFHMYFCSIDGRLLKIHLRIHQRFKVTLQSLVLTELFCSWNVLCQLSVLSTERERSRQGYLEGGLLVISLHKGTKGPCTSIFSSTSHYFHTWKGFFWGGREVNYLDKVLRKGRSKQHAFNLDYAEH